MYQTQLPFFTIKFAPGFIVAVAILDWSYAAQSSPELEAKDVIAIQLRAQGLPCTKPRNPIHDIPGSSRDEMTWIITCNEATYRVKLIPHLGSKVEIIDDSGTARGIGKTKE